MAATRDNPTQLVDAKRSTSAREREAVFSSLCARVKFAGRWLAGVSLAFWLVVWSFAERLALVASRGDQSCGGIIDDWPTPE